MCLSMQVVDIMRVNVDKVLERDQKISELDDRAGEWLGRTVTYTSEHHEHVFHVTFRRLKGLHGFVCECARAAQ